MIFVNTTSIIVNVKLINWSINCIKYSMYLVAKPFNNDKYQILGSLIKKYINVTQVEQHKLHSSNFGNRTSFTPIFNIRPDMWDRKFLGNSTQSITYTIITVIKNDVSIVFISI